MQSISNASHKRYNGDMKTATIPPVRIDPSFRKDIEQSLEGGESLASLVETAVRNEVTRRRVQSEFIRRGMAAIDRTVAAGDGVPAEVVIAKLEAKLAAARRAKKAA
jgi:predicted transcriptional regulator